MREYVSKKRTGNLRALGASPHYSVPFHVPMRPSVSTSAIIPELVTGILWQWRVMGGLHIPPVLIDLAPVTKLELFGVKFLTDRHQTARKLAI
jgi:hypothetical protein